MYGSGLRKFVADNKLGKGQLVLFYLDQPSPRAVFCVIQFRNGAENEGSEGENDYMEVSDEEDEDRQADNSDDDDDIVRTRGLELTQEEESDLDGLLPINNGFIGLAFLHRLTATNVLLGSMNYKGMIVGRQVIHEAGNLKGHNQSFF